MRHFTACDWTRPWRHVHYRRYTKVQGFPRSAEGACASDDHVTEGNSLSVQGSASVQPLRLKFQPTFRTSYRFVAKSLLVDRHQGLLSLVLMKDLAGKYSEEAIL